MKLAVIVCLTLLPALVATALADSWALPSTREYFSDNGEYCVTIVPREFKPHVKGGEDAHSADVADRAVAPNPPHATLTHLVHERDPITMWTTSLVNDVAPARALVSDNGEYVVTFDNWGSMGHGDDAIVIYDATGKLIREFSLVEIVGKRRVKNLPRSVSSINWGGKHAFSAEGESVLIRIVHSKSRYGSPKGKPTTYFTKRIRLRDGRVIDGVTQWVTYGVLFGTFCIVLFLVLSRKRGESAEECSRLTGCNTE